MGSEESIRLTQQHYLSTKWGWLSSFSISVQQRRMWMCVCVRVSDRTFSGTLGLKKMDEKEEKRKLRKIRANYKVKRKMKWWREGLKENNHRPLLPTSWRRKLIVCEDEMMHLTGWERRVGGRWRGGRTVLDNKKLIRRQCAVIALLIPQCVSFIWSNTFESQLNIELY